MTVVPDTLEDAALALADGRPCIFPTDTVYGVGVAVCAASGPDILFDVKQRDARKPIAWLVGSIDDLQRYGKNLPSAVCQLVQRFWPGALTVIVEASDIVPASYRSESGTIGLRMPANETTLALIRRVGRPLATTLTSAVEPRCLDLSRLMRNCSQGWGALCEIQLNRCTAAWRLRLSTALAEA